MTAWLASITDVAEARQVLTAGAAIVDAKNPHAGALGALPHDTVRAIVAVVGGRVPVSATIGDFPDMNPAAVAAAVAAMAATGVDFVKIGLLPSPTLADCLDALVPLARRHRLVAVLFADREPDFKLIERLAERDFTGVMLDTADKAGGGLLAYQPVARLAQFVAQAKGAGLLSGLAGSLKLADISVLAPIGADYLGFRGALCRNHARTWALDPGALAALSEAMGRAAVQGA
ncbi:(5-formylfuran-3-yl)methyl phosphate synthase [Thiobacillus denitrificans]|uniref:(5-formylfuran-3-yl)methyl phosphate synthase n=1 Tax=Thiobacillus denitrificans TaxID=36861 RepID=UPI000361ADB7|nr:(5-formylfuran-3-yl)methyl phosphate synthase [Thiobacillus denitrificans]